MQIKIIHPIDISFTVIKVDTKVPSLKMAVLIHTQNFSSLFRYQAELWFECQMIDNVIEQLNLTKEVYLSDMNGTFKLELNPVTQMCSWSINEEITDLTVIKLDGTHQLTNEAFMEIREAFHQLPRWW